MSLYDDILADVFGSGNVDGSKGGLGNQVQACFYREIAEALAVEKISQNDFDKLWERVQREFPEEAPTPGRPVSSPSGRKRVPLTVRIDPTLKERARKAGVQFGPLLEKAIKQRLKGDLCK